ncbi:MAG: hypothetical protein HYT11_01450 [Candidatus Levybacteria bacterium]|nr:hypothetical protein [Candidatus Levybacteria bacterium]
MKTLRDHLSYYISLALCMLLGGFLIVVSSPYVQLQFLFIVITAFFYIMLGILHHVLHHDLHVKIVVEYLLIGGLVIAVAFFLFI